MPTLNATLTQLRARFETSLSKAPCLSDGHYILPYASKRAGFCTTQEKYSIVDELPQAIKSSAHRAFVILADSGMGKTTLGLGLCDYFWHQLESEPRGRVPLYIHLPQYVTKGELSRKLLDDFLKEVINDDDARQIKQQPLLLILDGYDEITDRHNIYTVNHWSRPGYDIKMVTTCRPEVLHNSEEDALFEVSGLSYQTHYLQAFDEQLIQAYLTEFIANPTPAFKARYQNTDWLKNLDNYNYWLKQLPTLRKLAETPFLLTLIVRTLPAVVDAYPDKDELTRSRLSQTDVFELFTQDWFQQQTQRLKSSGQLLFLSDKQCGSYLKAYAQNLAARLIQPDGEINQALLDDTLTLDGRLLEPTHEAGLLDIYGSTHRAHFTTHPEDVKSIRSGCLFNTEGGKFRFLHKSLVEFLAARELFQGLHSEYDLYLNQASADIASTGPGLNRQLIKDIQVIARLVERIKTETAFHDLLLRIIMRSKDTPGLSIMAANAITFLNAAGTSFSGEDFSDIQIPGANLQYALCSGTDFRGANLCGVNFAHAWLAEARMEGAHCRNLTFGELPSLECPENVNALVHYKKPGSNDAYWLAACNDGYAYQWEVKTQKLFKKYNHGSYWFTASVPVTALTVMLREQPLLVTGGANSIYLWSLDTGKVLKKLKTNGSCLAAATYLATAGGEENMIRLWEIPSGSAGPVLRGHTDMVQSISFSADSNWLASGSDDYTIRLWQMPGGVAGRVLREHTGPVQSVSFSADSQWLASGSGDKTIRLWQMPAGAAGPVLLGHTDWVRSVSFSGDSQWLASGSSDNAIRLWQMPNGKAGPVLQGHTNWVQSVRFTADSQWLASGGADKMIRSWQMPDGKAEPVLQGHTDWVRSVSFSADLQWLASGSDDYTIRLWQMPDGVAGPVLQGHTDWVRSVSFSANSKWLASGGDDKTIRLWQMPDGLAGPVLRGHTDSVSSLSFSADSQWLASGSNDKTIRSWHMPDGLAGPVLKGHTDWVRSVSFSANSQWLASGSKDKTIRLWKMPDGVAGPVLQKHAGRVQSVSFSADSQWLASGSKDNTVRLWQVPNGKSELVLQGHAKWVRSVSFSADSQWLASGGDDKTIRLWQVPEGTCSQTIAVWFDIFSLAFTPKAQSWTLAVAGGASNLMLFDRDIAKNTWCISWTHKPPSLTFTGLQLMQSVDLTEDNQRLCQQRGASGAPALTGEAYQAWCSLFQPIPGTAATLHSSIFNTNAQRLDVLEDPWVVTLARKKSATSSSGFFSSSKRQTSMHAFLVIEGVQNHRRFVIHADLTTPDKKVARIEVTSWFSPGSKKEIAAFDAKAYEFRQWAITKEIGLKLLDNIRLDKQKTLAYARVSLGGLGVDYQNCISWCLAQLRKIDIDLPQTWSEGCFINPQTVLPEEAHGSSSYARAIQQ
jgi:WD40 repeat protein